MGDWVKISRVGIDPSDPTAAHLDLKMPGIDQNLSYPFSKDAPRWSIDDESKHFCVPETCFGMRLTAPGANRAPSR